MADNVNESKNLTDNARRVIPDFTWYAAESRRWALSPRCPFASVHACPRYYQSLFLLGKAGCTAIPQDEDAALKGRWERHPLWPVVDEQATQITRSDKRPHAFHKFCPEVLGETFGYFATFLAPYTDELDSGLASERLGKEGASANDPRWNWAFCTPQHFTECPLYSCLSHDWTKQLSTFSSILPASVRYDVFISHASEDKNSFVRGLAAELTRLGLRVWFDEWTLKLGDSLRRRIDEGLRSSSFGVVVLSPSFFAKDWPQAELDGLFAIEMSGHKAILPVRHQMTHAELLKRSPLLAGKLATDSGKGVSEVAREICEVVRDGENEAVHTAETTPR